MCGLTLTELLNAIGGRLEIDGTAIPAPQLPVGRIVTDSHAVELGDVFWARVGPQHDGADFADQAFAHGASGVVAERPIPPPAGRWSVRVHDAHLALWQLAAEVRRRFAGRVIAVAAGTGTTTTCSMIHAVLSQQWAGTANTVHGSNHVALPVQMLEWQPNHDYAVLELGGTQRGEVDALAALCRPQVGVVTNQAPTPIGQFASQQAPAEPAAELLAALPAHGWAVLNGEDHCTEPLVPRCRAQIVRTGRSNRCEVCATEVRTRRGWLHFRVDGYPLQILMAGRDDLPAALAAVAVGRIFEHDLDVIAAGLRRLEAPPQPAPTANRRGIAITSAIGQHDGPLASHEQ